MKERNHLSYYNHENLALHIDSVNLADGDYELIPADSLAASEGNLNCDNVNQDLGQQTISLTVPKKASPGALI